MEELLSLGVNLDRVGHNNTYRRSGINFVSALFAAKTTNRLGQSVAVLKCIIKETPTHHEMISPDIVLESSLCVMVRDATLFLVAEGAYTDVYDILTAMLDTIDNIWDDISYQINGTITSKCTASLSNS